MAFKKKKPLNPLSPFNTTGAPLEDHTNYHGPKKKTTKAKPKKKTK